MIPPVLRTNNGDIDGLVSIRSAHGEELNLETIGIGGGDDVLGTKKGKIGTLNMGEIQSNKVSECERLK